MGTNYTLGETVSIADMDDVEKVSNDVSLLNEDLGDHIDNTALKLDTITSNISTVSTKIDTLATVANNIYGKVDTEIATINTNLNTVDGIVDTINTNVTSIKNTLSTVSTNVANLNNRLTDDRAGYLDYLANSTYGLNAIKSAINTVNSTVSTSGGNYAIGTYIELLQASNNDKSYTYPVFACVRNDASYITINDNDCYISSFILVSPGIKINNCQVFNAVKV